MTAIMICGEGPHDVGHKEWDSRTGDHVWLEGWMQPLIRKVAPDAVEIKTRYLKELFLTRRPPNLKPIPKGQRDKAAVARLIAKLEGCSAVVYMTDADTNDEAERRAKVTEITEGFAYIENDVAGIACVPRSASESWLLSDLLAWQSLGLEDESCFPKGSPEDLWGARDDSSGNHPKHAFARVADKAGIADNRDTRNLVCEGSSLQTMQQRCPVSLVEFVQELAKLQKQEER